MKSTGKEQPMDTEPTGGRIDPFAPEGADEIDDDPDLDEDVDLADLSPRVERQLREEFGDEKVDHLLQNVRSRRA